MEKKRMNFLDLLVKDVPYSYNFKKPRFAKKPIEHLGYEVDDSHRFRNSVYIFEAPGKCDEKPKKNIVDLKPTVQYPTPKIYTVDLTNWENNIADDQIKQHPVDIETQEYINKLLETNWENNIIYDTLPPYRPLVLYTDDPNLIFEVVEKKQKIKKKNLKNTNFDKPLKNKYNISNDKYYENETKIKTSLVSFGVQHSIPALKLNLEFYKINHTKHELRNFHKPKLIMENKEFMFSKPLQITPGSNIIKKPYEITCNDLSEFIVFEYSEEYPFFITNPGMASVCNKYYRKVDNNDDIDPKDYIILEPEDDGPFLGYGEIPKGETGECLDNNLFVAPIFKHTTKDVLIILTENKLIYRPIHNVYVVGQEYPKDEIFIPHSRRLNQYCKDQVKLLAYRSFNKSNELSLSVLDNLLPHFSESAKRKWLKDFTEVYKKGKDTVFTLKSNSVALSEEELRKMVTPENVCQYQSMLSGEQMMEDLGYKVLEGEDEETDFLPNWILCKNFVNATNGKGFLEIKGLHDPTGIGEGISFGKMKFKKVSESENRKLMAEHQANYKTEIMKVWNRQWASLSSNEDLSKPKNSGESNLHKKNNKIDTSQSETTNYSKVLQIKRTYIENGNTTVSIQKITDPKLIKAYLKAKKKTKIDDKKSALRCSSCGQVGHMKTNKNCPNYIGIKKQPREKKQAKNILQDKMLKLISQFIAIPFSSPFHRPVSDKKFPTYKTIIKTPMDFQTIKSNIKSGKYTNYDMFLSDIILIYENCKLFNGEAHSLTEISNDFVEKAKKYKMENYNELIELAARIPKNE